ncbi:MAG: efflux RND transporter permease subunit [Pseudomonadales bacterium]
MKEIDTHKGLIAWFARNHVAANLLMIVIILTGIISLLTVRTQIFPNLEIDRVSIDVPFPGASPGEVESGVVARLEEAVREIEGLSEMRSYSREGMGSLRLELETGYDIQVVMDEVKMAVDRIASFPESTEKPSIYRNQHQRGAINVQIWGDLNEKRMKLLAEQIRDEIVSLPSVTKADITGARAYEISIEVKESRLQQYGLTLKEVAQAIRRSSLDLPAGSIRSDSGDILLRTEGQAYEKSDFERLVLVSRSDGTRLMLGDIAVISDGFVEQNFYSLFNGEPSIGISVYAIADQNQIDISREVSEYVERRKQTLPPGIHLDSWMDSTTYLSGTLSMMMFNMLSGVILVLVVLGIFLRLQLAFWVMLGLPIAFLGAFALLPLIGGSINLISLFGFILVLGIVVDDAIIIGESVQTATDQDGQSIENVIKGAKRVAMPATFGVLTTIMAFTPLILVPGTFGALPAAIGSVVMLCLLFSIIESKLILPAHLASMKPLVNDQASKSKPLRRFQDKFAKRLHRFVHEIYEPILLRAIEFRYITTSIFVAMLFLALGYVAGPYIKVVFFPDMSSDYIVAQVELVEGSSPAQAEKVIKNMTDSLLSLDDAKAEDEKFLANFMAFTTNSTGTIAVELKSNAGDPIDADKIASQWRAIVGSISGAKTLEISGSEKSHGGGGDIEFKLVSDNNEDLMLAAELLEQTLRSYDGLYDIENTNRGNIPEINLKIKPSAEALGLALTDLAEQVRAAFYGVEAQRIQRGREEVKVMVRYPRADRESLGNLETMYIRTRDGDEVPFSAVADLEERVTPSSIARSWGKRAVSVSANVEKTIALPGDIVREILEGSFKEELTSLYPSVRLELDGASLEESELLDHLFYTAALALFGIYALMAVPLRSYLQPLIIMGVIPFGIIGALIGHLIVGIEFSALSIFGIVALAGVVVNDSIIMVDFVNQSVEDGMEISEAAVKAGTERFRAIMLTSLTTFFGLLPILLETSFTAQLVIPMAVSLGFGILFATVITLILIPCLYVILDDLKVSTLVVTTS